MRRNEAHRTDQGNLATTPAILLSGKVRIYDRDTQADVFLPKGMYAPAELLESIRRLLIRKRGPKRTTAGLPAKRQVA